MESEIEIWAPLFGYEGVYEVSSFGRVKALEREWYSGEHLNIKKSKKEHLMKLHLNKYGYVSVTLNNRGQSKRTVHRLVALTFILNPHNKPYINHKDGDRTNNHINNLEWCTNSENILHAYKTGLQVSQKRGDHPHARRIKCINFDTEYRCMKDASDILGVSAYSIGKICNNKQVHADGLTFRYI